mmetsp:Transcript_21302/g.60761  ORF Transcript_21302/g.60761 Transcript_21302/m.60761 type:complete len:390 (-) Transcript_21302:944-2113(-)
MAVSHQLGNVGHHIALIPYPQPPVRPRHLLQAPAEGQVARRWGGECDEPRPQVVEVDGRQVGQGAAQRVAHEDHLVRKAAMAARGVGVRVAVENGRNLVANRLERHRKTPVDLHRVAICRTRSRLGLPLLGKVRPAMPDAPEPQTQRRQQRRAPRLPGRCIHAGAAVLGWGAWMVRVVGHPDGHRDGDARAVASRDVSGLEWCRDELDVGEHVDGVLGAPKADHSQVQGGGHPDDRACFVGDDGVHGDVPLALLHLNGLLHQQIGHRPAPQRLGLLLLLLLRCRRCCCAGCGCGCGCVCRLSVDHIGQQGHHGQREGGRHSGCRLARPIGGIHRHRLNRHHLAAAAAAAAPAVEGGQQLGLLDDGLPLIVRRQHIHQLRNRPNRHEADA